MTEVRIITPPGMFGADEHDNPLDAAMRLIGIGFGSEDEWSSKYGTNVENDVFMMHRFCWCDGVDCPWCSYSGEEGRHLTPVAQSKGAVDNDHGAGGAPHFWFKPSGFRLWWYKYIGRDTETYGDLPADFLQQVFATHPKGMTVEGAIAEAQRRDKAEEEAMKEMMAAIERGDFKDPFEEYFFGSEEEPPA